MNCYMEKTVLGLGVILVSASLLTACNTVQGTAVGVGHTAAGIGQTVTGAVVGAGKDIHATEKAIVAPQKKAVHHKPHHEATKKSTDTSATPATTTSETPAVQN